MTKRVVIIGAGPVGLGAAYRLQELGYSNWAIYERHPYIGGLATSFQDRAGFTYGIGGHVMFSHFPFFYRPGDKVLGRDFTNIFWGKRVLVMDRWGPLPSPEKIS